MYIPRALFPYVAFYQESAGDRIDFSPRPGFVPPAAKIVFICFTNRSGSTYLGELVATSNRLNMPHELFNADALLDLPSSPGRIHIGDYVTQIVTARATQGWFVVKASLAQIAALAAAGVLDAIVDQSYFLYTERLDKVYQSISWQIATQSKAFTSYHSAAPVEPLYDWEQIKRGVDGIIRTNALTQEFFSLNGITPFGVFYENMIENPAALGAAIGAWLGIGDFTCNPAAIRLKEQRNQVNAQWRDRFLSHCQNKFAPHVVSVVGWPTGADETAPRP